MIDRAITAVIILMESCSFCVFWNMFFSKKMINKWLRFFTIFMLIYIGSALTGILGKWKILEFIILLSVICKLFYKATWWQSIFFSSMGYLFKFLDEVVFVRVVQELDYDFPLAPTAVCVLGVVSNLAFIFIILFIRKILGNEPVIYLIDGKYWIPFMIMPVLSAICMIFIYGEFIDGELGDIHGYFGMILLIANMATLLILLRMLQDKEALRQAVIKERDTKKKLDYFHDMQSIFERQGRKLHDYKNQLLTIQNLIKDGNTEQALHFIEGLTESISVEMSAVNTNQPVINAVLNQKYHMARSRGIKMIFTIGDLSETDLNEEEIVVVFGNLLDNAIHECESIVNKGAKAVVNIKAIYEGGQLEIYVKNPVVKKVDIYDGEVSIKAEDGHGLGLTNIRDVVERHDGSFAINCDSNEFTAIVII